jgi:AcrR family transcriptional regulator
MRAWYAASNPYLHCARKVYGLGMTPAAPSTTPPLRRRSHAERSAGTRAQLLSAAAELVRGGGVQAASMFEVAKAAGVTPGALQHHFGSKAELMMQVIEHILRSDDGSGVAWPVATLPLPRRCRAFVDGLWSGVYAPRRFLTAWAIYFGSHGDRELMARIGARRRQVSADLRLRFLAVFPELAARPAAAADLADLVLASLRGLALTRLFDDSADPGPGVRRELARLIEDRCRATAPTAGPSILQTPSPRRKARLP